MKKSLPFVLLFGMVGLFVAAYIFQNWDPYRNVPPVSLNRLNQQEADWHAEGIRDYRLLVQVSFATEQRRYDIEVRKGELSTAQSARWDEQTEVWGSYAQVAEEEARFFTIPGMFNMLRADLLNQDVDREVLRMELADGARHPGLIFLGNIIQDGFPVEGTELLVEVLDFELVQP